MPGDERLVDPPARQRHSIWDFTGDESEIPALAPATPPIRELRR
jgi:hypothetical protein